MITLTGSLPAGGPSPMAAYPVPEPSRYAATLLMEALAEKGVRSSIGAPGDKVDFKVLAANYEQENEAAEHVSPALKEDVKITLKVSQNLHASMTPFLLGALLAHAQTRIDQAGFDPAAVPVDRRGLAESIRARMASDAAMVPRNRAAVKMIAGSTPLLR